MPVINTTANFLPQSLLESQANFPQVQKAACMHHLTAFDKLCYVTQLGVIFI